MSHLGAAPSQNYFPTAELLFIFSRQRQSRPKLVSVAVSQNIYWKSVCDDKSDVPRSLADFCDVDWLEISRIEDETSSKDVEDVVIAEERNGRHCVIVSGVLHGPARRRNSLHNANLKICIITENRELRDEWVDQIRALVAPWKLLRRRMKELVRNIRSERQAKELGNQIGGIIQKLELNENRTVSETPSRHNDGISHVLAELPEQLEKLEWLDKLNVQGVAAVGFAAAVTRLADNAELVAETAKFAADISKCFAFASTVFQLVVLSARLISMFAEAHRGRKVLPGILDQIVVRLGYVLKSLITVLISSSNADGVQVDFVFDVLEQMVDTMSEIEGYLLCGRGRQFLYSKVVQEVETKMNELEHKVVTVTNTSQAFINSEIIAALGAKVAQLQSEPLSTLEEHHHPRPELYPFFVGRSKEISKLGDILRMRGSAVISQYGGVGKTELMIAFAVRAEQNKSVPGGVFWVTVEGEKADVVDSLANLAEKFMTREMSTEERKNLNLIVAELKRGLSLRKGRWLLCLDNADSNELGCVLDAICGMADPTRDNGWVLVTSRRGQPSTWNRMKDDQKLILDPLSEEDAMVVLWRQVRSVQAHEMSDESVMIEINNMKKQNWQEYYALRELCGYKCAHSLGGLPLALIQAGSYIRQYKCSFREYLNLFREAYEKEDLKDILEKAQQSSAISEKQRSILTTWSISVARLSDKAHGVLRALSMLGTSPIPYEFVTGILQNVDKNGSVEGMLRNVVRKELVHGSSLVYCEDKRRGRVFAMHRLVRRFVLAEMSHGSVIWNKVYDMALLSAHSWIGQVLRMEGKSFNDLPDLFGDHHRSYFPHTLALIDHLSIPNSSTVQVRFVSELQEIYWYTGSSLQFLGKLDEAVNVWKGLLRVFRLHHGKSTIPHQIATVMDNLGIAYRIQGNLDDAEYMFQGSLTLRRALYGHDVDRRDIAWSLHSLGTVYRDQVKLEDAESMLSQSLKMRRVICGVDTENPDIAWSLHSMGNVYRDQGRLEEAESMFVQSLKIRQSIYRDNPNHPDVAWSIYSMGTIYQNQGKMEEAEASFKQSLNMRRYIFGADTAHPDIALTLYCLGVVYRSRRKLDDAESMYRQCLKMQRTIYGDVSLRVAYSLYSLGIVFRDQGDLGETVLKWREGIAILRSLNAENPPFLLSVIDSRLAVVLQQLKAYT